MFFIVYTSGRARGWWPSSTFNDGDPIGFQRWVNADNTGGRQTNVIEASELLLIDIFRYQRSIVILKWRLGSNGD